MAFWNQYHPQQTKWDMLAIGPFRVVKWKSCMSFLCRECSLPIHHMGGTLSKTKKVDFLNGPSYWKWCVWDGQCFGSFEVSHPVKKSKFGMILTRYQLTCPQPLVIPNSTCYCRCSRMLQSWLKPRLLWKQPKRTGFVGWKLRGDEGAPNWLGIFSRIQLIQFMTFLNQNRPQTNQVGYVSSMDLFLVVLSGLSSKWKWVLFM